MNTLSQKEIDAELKKVRSKTSVTEVIPGLFLGNEYSALNKSFFDKNGIQFVINFTPDVPNKFKSKGVEYLRVKIDDSLLPQDIARMTKDLPDIVRFLNKKHKIEKKKVLVHCHAGMQRSAIVVAAYLMKLGNLKPMEAIRAVIKKRPIAFLNGQSLNFERSLRVYYTDYIKPKEKKKSPTRRKSPTKRKSPGRSPKGPKRAASKTRKLKKTKKPKVTRKRSVKRR